MRSSFFLSLLHAFLSFNDSSRMSIGFSLEAEDNFYQVSFRKTRHLSFLRFSFLSIDSHFFWWSTDSTSSKMCSYRYWCCSDERIRLSASYASSLNESDWEVEDLLLSEILQDKDYSRMQFARHERSARSTRWWLWLHTFFWVRDYVKGASERARCSKYLCFLWPESPE